jgi:hypothetical protein
MQDAMASIDFRQLLAVGSNRIKRLYTGHKGKPAAPAVNNIEIVSYTRMREELLRF